MDRRMHFITEFLSELDTVTELADRYGISRKTAYYWIRRFREGGVARLAGASHRPHTMPRATPAAIVAHLVSARHRHPTWGAGKLRDWLRRRAPEIAWPCRDTIHTILTRSGLVRHRRRRTPLAAPPRPLTVPTAPNVVWTMDFKGDFRTGDGTRCYPLTVRDGYSRFVLRCAALSAPRTAVTAAQLLRTFATYGLPERIRSDNGAPFAATGLGGLSRLAVWWLRLGIWPERIRPGCPQQNGSHEQFHRVLKRETAHPPAGSLAAQQRRFASFVTEYNHERPHDAVNHAPPASRYAASPRSLPARLPELEYPAAFEIRRVCAGGRIKWQSRTIFLTHTLAGEDVALEPIADGLWLIRFAAMPLALFDERHWRLRTPADAERVSPITVD